MQDCQELIPPMDLAELRSAMEQQAQSVGLRFEADLANTLLDDVAGEPGAMPLLQHALLELWKRRHGRWLRAEEYRNLGGVREAIARTADGVYDQAVPDEQRLIRHIFLRLTRVDEGAEAGAERRDTRHRVVMTELVPAGADPGPTRELVKRLADASLVVTSLKKKAQVAPGRPDEDPQRRQLELVEVEVAHEALIRHWKRLEDWLNEDRAALRLRQNLNQDAGEWEQGDRAEALLPRWNAPLEEAQVLAHRGDLVLSDLEQDYLQAAAALRDQEAAEKEAQQQQELEQQRALAEEQRQRAEEAEQATAKQSKLTRIAFGVGAVALILAILAGVASLWATNSANEADRQRSVALAASTAEARQKATAEAASTVAVNERNKAQAEAERAEEEARKAMGSRAEALAYQVPAKGSEALVSAVRAIGPYLGNHDPIPPEIVAGLTAAVAAGRGSIPLQISGDRITFARLSFDDELVFTASKKGNLHIWDRHDGHQQIQLERVDGEITEVAFSPTKNLVAAATERGGALWDLLSGELIYTYEGTIGDPAGFTVEDLVIKFAEKSVPVPAKGQRISHAALSSDMKLILTSDGNGTLQLWDRYNGQLLREFDNISPSITQIAFSPTGKYVGALIEDRTALWDLASGKLAVGPDESLGNDVERREVAELLQKGPKQGKAECDIPPSLSSIKDKDRRLVAARCQPNSEVFVLASAESPYKSTLEIYNNNGDLISNLVGHQWRVEIASFSGNGSRLATGGEDRNILIWEEDPKTRDWRAVATLAGHKSGIRYIYLSRDGWLLLSVDAAGEARIWDLENTGSLRSVTTPHGVAFARFAQNGHYVISAGKWTVYSWDVPTGDWMWRTIGNFSAVPVVSPDGKQVLIAGQGGRIRVVDTVTGEFIRYIDTKIESLNSIVFSPKGDSLLTIGGQGNAIIWDLEDAKPKASFLLPAERFPMDRVCDVCTKWQNYCYCEQVVERHDMALGHRNRVLCT